MRFHALAAQLDFLAWRDAQLVAISDQVEETFPDLLAALTSRVDEAGRLNLLRSTFTLKVVAEDTIRDWTRKQLETACSRAESELDQTLLELPGGLDIDSDIREQIFKAAPAICAQGETDPIKFAELRRSALPQAETLVKGMRDTVASIGSQAELARHLLANQISGPAYLAETVGEQDAPLLLLPASNR